MDRGMIKWEPFNSVVSASKIIKDVLNEKEKMWLKDACSPL